MRKIERKYRFPSTQPKNLWARSRNWSMWTGDWKGSRWWRTRSAWYHTHYRRPSWLFGL